MAEGTFVALYRVSTERQGRSGLGLEAQREAVRTYLNGGLWTLAAEYIEVESGRAKERPELDKALARCRVLGATLVVSNVSRLTRSVSFLSRLLEAGVEVRFCDLPQIEGPTGRFLLQQMVAVAELEAGLVSQRTKSALAAAKARGVKLGNPGNLKNRDLGHIRGQARRIEKANNRVADLAPILAEVKASGALSLREIAAALNDRNIPTPRGGRWSAVQVQRMMKRIDGTDAPYGQVHAVRTIEPVEPQPGKPEQAKVVPRSGERVVTEHLFIEGTLAEVTVRYNEPELRAHFMAEAAKRKSKKLLYRDGLVWATPTTCKVSTERLFSQIDRLGSYTLGGPGKWFKVQATPYTKAKQT